RFPTLRSQALVALADAYSRQVPMAEVKVKKALADLGDEKQAQAYELALRVLAEGRKDAPTEADLSRSLDLLLQLNSTGKPQKDWLLNQLEPSYRDRVVQQGSKVVERLTSILERKKKPGAADRDLEEKVLSYDPQRQALRAWLNRIEVPARGADLLS